MVGWVVLSFGIVFAAPPPEEVRRAAKEVLSDERIQSEFPGGRPRGSGRPLPRAEPRRERRDGSSTSLGAGSGLASVIMWLVIAVVVALGIFFLASKMMGYAPDLALAEIKGTAADARAPPIVALIDDAESFANRGEYDLAVHTLLLLALQSLGEQVTLGDSLTSREIVRNVDMPEAAEEPIRGLVGAVEITIFGGRPTTREEYERARTHYEAFAQALTTRAA